MSATKHYPLPWRVTGDLRSGTFTDIIDGNGSPVCRVGSRIEGTPDNIRELAALLLAAPSLLAACRELVAFSFAAEESRGDYASALRDFCRLKRNIRAAIAEAEGRP